MSSPQQTDPQQTGPNPSALAGGKPPVGNGPVAALGPLWAIALITLGAVGIHDGLSYAGAVAGEPWIERFLTEVNGATAPDWIIPAGLVAVVLGLWLLAVALRSRPRRGIALTAQTGVFLTPASVRRIADRAARDVDGVETTSTTSKTKRLTVTATIASNDTEATKNNVIDAIRSRLEPLEEPPVIRIRAKTPGGDQ